ncbi:MAG TPA: dephospho-CoA kinase [Terriglobia bacterium]|nr:dephospho-CoA kinase [Terriglobia bacterium]
MAYFGLTGGIASGKSTVARMFEELGAWVIDADKIGHELLGSSLSAYQEIVHCFGDEILDSTGEIDRKQLGAVVFADKKKLDALNAIVHPGIVARVDQLAAEYTASHPGAVVLVDAALIFEAGIGSSFRKVIVAWCRPEQQIQRLMAKTGFEREEAERRIAAQMPAEEKRKLADFVIDCSGTLANTRTQLQELFPKLKHIAASE